MSGFDERAYHADKYEITWVGPAPGLVETGNGRRPDWIFGHLLFAELPPMEPRVFERGYLFRREDLWGVSESRPARSVNDGRYTNSSGATACGCERGWTIVGRVRASTA